MSVTLPTGAIASDSSHPPRPPGADLGNQRGEFVGPYQLLEIIGEGGFGTVWLAERREPIVQRVALKVIKAGMDTRAVIARFEQERQALAVMNHPNVAKVFDAGTTPNGRPYFVMEHVPGESITLYADRHRFTVRQRLELFVPVCEAIQHAHHKGIIHRDIKPSNILVSVRDGQPVPKIIDFGVAKAVSHTLTEQSIFTEHGQLIGTPEYMSPEQAEMGATDIDTRTDVYSLGVVLYELLSGLLPFDATSLRAAGYDAICKILREQDAPKPSTRLSTADDATGKEIARRRVVEREHLARELRRELDWIPLKALRKDRTQRYDTPADLARDIQRYLDGQPLEAGPEALGYRLKKFIRRNKGAVLAISAVFAALVVGLVATLGMWQYARTEAANARAAEGEQARLAEDARLARIDADEKRIFAEAKTVEAQAERAKAETERIKAVKAGETIEANSYVANVQMAQAAMDNRQFDRVRQRLDACPERLRGWEWRWLDATADTSLITFKGHKDEVYSSAFSPDGTRIFTASGDNTAQVCDAVTGTTIAELKGQTGWVTSAAFSPDSARIVAASNDNAVRVWDAATGTSIAELKGHTDFIRSAAFSPDSARIVTASHDDTARVWDVTTGTNLAILKGHTDAVTSAAFSPDGSRIVTASGDTTARVWDAAIGTTIAELRGHRDAVTSAAFSPDGTRIVTGSHEKTARVWDAASGTSIAELTGHTDDVTSAAFSPDSARIVTASHDNAARVWHAATGATIAELKGHTGWVSRAAFSPDGARILTASRDNTARVWDAATGNSISEHKGHTGWVYSATFSPDGTRIFTGSDDETARVWDAAIGNGFAELKGHTSQVASAVFSPDSARIVTAAWDNTARVWDAVTGNTVAELTGHKGEVNSAAFSPDGTRIVTGSHDKTARVWDAASGTSIGELTGHAGAVTSAAFSPDGTRIVTVPGDKSARVWDAATGTSVAELKGHTGWVTSAAFSPDGTRIVTGSHDKTARVSDVATGNSIAELKGHAGAVTSAAFSPDGTRIVTVPGDKSARVWEAATGDSIAELKGHTSQVTSAAFSPDGSRIVTASWDNTARVWDAAIGTSLAELKGHTREVTSAAFSPDGTRIVTASGDKTARVWESVPYRERFPAIQGTRAAAAKMGPIVHARLRAGESPETLRAELNADASLTPAERAAAQWALKTVLDEQRRAREAPFVEADTLNDAAWNAVRFAPVEPEAATKAVADARRAVELAPKQGYYLNTLGVVLYRTAKDAAEFQEALDTLVRSDAMNAKGAAGPQPADRAFIAMAHWKLGHEVEARTALAAFRELAATDRWKADAETIAWLKEAEALITPPSP
ncbi:MAG: protein kinase domain-containing protein [Phycisphaerae bacterium]